MFSSISRNVLFNDTFNTFYLRLYVIGHMVKDHSDSERGNPLPPHGDHRQYATRIFNDTFNTFYLRLYGVGHSAKNQLVREETRCRHYMCYSFRLAARFCLYRQDSTYHGRCYTSRGALAGTRNSSMGPPWRIDPTTHRAMIEGSYHGAISRSFTSIIQLAQS